MGGASHRILVLFPCQAGSKFAAGEDLDNGGDWGLDGKEKRVTKQAREGE